MIKEIIRSKLRLVLVCMLLLGCAYAAWQASYVLSNNSDVYASTYILVDAPVVNSLHFQFQHTNLFKIPILWAQAQFDFTYASFVLLNIALLAATVFGWLWLLLKTTRVSYFTYYALGLLFLLVATPYFAPQVAFTTIRNIEFPLAFLLIVVIAQLLQNGRRVWAIVGSILFSFVLASDNLLLYTLLPAIGVALALRWVGTDKQQKSERRNIYTAFGCLALMAVLAKALIFVIDKFDLMHLTTTGQTPLTIVGLAELPAAIFTTIQHIYTLFGAHIFGRVVDSYMVLLVGLAIAVVVSVLLVIVARLFIGWAKQLQKTGEFAAFTITLWGVVLVAFYVLIDLWKDFNNVRYISIAPLLLLFAVPYLVSTTGSWLQRLPLASRDVKQLLRMHWPKLTAIVLVLLFVGSGYISHKTYAQQKRDINATRGYYDTVNEIADRHDAHVGVSGYWDAIRTRFWTKDNVFLAPVAACNQALPYLTNDVWYEAEQDRRSMIIMDFTGDDAPNWKCGEDFMLGTYGEPLERIDIQGLRGSDAEVWIYDYDVRSKVDKSNYYK